MSVHSIKNIKKGLTSTLFLSLFAVASSVTISLSAYALNTEPTTSAVETSVSSAKPHSAFIRQIESLDWKNNQLEIQLNDASVSIRAINKGTVEVFYQVANEYQLPSFALPHNAPTFTKAKFETHDNSVHLVLPELTVKIDPKPFKISYYNAKGKLAEEERGLFFHETMRGFRFKLDDDEKLLGGGQRVLGMDRRGHRMPLYNRAHYGYTTESNQMYYSLPAVMSNKGYAIAFDNSANGHLDLGHSESHILQFEAEAGRTSYLFSAGNTMQNTVEHFVDATGKQPLPPRWALGNYASRFGYKTQQEVLDTVALFKELDFPLDAVVIDLYWFGPDIKGHMGNLNWDLDNWPEPTNMISTLSQQGVNTIMITEPFILSSSSQWQSALDNHVLAKDVNGHPRRFDFYFGNTGLVDVFDTNAQNWFWQYYAALNEQGVTGWWGDLGEPEVHPADSIHIMSDEYGEQHEGKKVTANEIHNAYGHQWAKMVFNKQRELSPNRRPFVMMRAGFVGSQRYGMIPWTGDVDRSWGGLKPQVELALQMGMFGLAYIHSDLGGFAGGETFDPELYTRWMQYGVFQPVYRPHAQDHIAPEPVFHDKTTQDIVRKYVKLRYSLLPYNYSLSIKNSLTGLPMMQPLFMQFPEQSFDRTDAYMWGDAFLVAPIVRPGITEKSVELPAGVWFDFWEHEKVEGGQTLSISSPLEKLPVLVRAGSFVPSVDGLNNTSAYSSENLNVSYYADASVQNASYTMYEDDGTDPDSLKDKKYQQLKFSAQHTADNEAERLSIKVISNGNYASAPARRSLNLSLHGIDAMPRSVKVDGKTISIKAGLDSAEANRELAIYDQSTNTLLVTGVLVKILTVDLVF